MLTWKVDQEPSFLCVNKRVKQHHCMELVIRDKKNKEICGKFFGDILVYIFSPNMVSYRSRNESDTCLVNTHVYKYIALKIILLIQSVTTTPPPNNIADLYRVLYETYFNACALLIKHSYSLIFLSRNFCLVAPSKIKKNKTK